MNLLARFKKIKRFFKPGLIVLIPVFLGCDAAEDLGTQFDLNTNIDVKLAELDLPSSNLYIDSLRTDGEDRLIAGTYNDPLTGRVTAEGYFQFKFQRGFFPGDSLMYDSIQLILATGEILPLTGSSPIDIDVFEIEDTLINSIVYLATKQETKSRQVGNLTGTVSSEDELVSIKLDDTYGQEIFDFLNDFPDSVATHFFKGLALSSGVTNQSLVSFNTAADTSRLRVFMTGDTTYFAEFDIQPSFHTNITRDRSASVFSSIQEKQTFDLAGDGRTVLDPLAGITTTFDVDALETFFADNPNILINTTIIDFEGEGFATRDTLQGFNLFFRRPDGGIFGPAIVQNSFANIVMADQGYLTGSSTPAAVQYNSDTDKYLVRPTLFFQSMYNNYLNSGNLVYIEPLRGDTIQLSEIVLINPTEMTLGQTVFSNNGIKLRIFYTDVNQ
ncbi:MAG: DUF4270 family protein [Cyclobacteriaceae bacterium]